MKRIFIVIAIILCATVAAASEDTALWGSAGGWNIRVDRTVGNGCYAVAAFEGDTIVRIGFAPSGGTAYLMLGDKDWTSLEVGKEYDILITFDSESPWTAPATADRLSDGTSTLTSTFSEGEFFYEFARKHGMRVTFNNKEVLFVSLKGSVLATAELLRCQTALNDAAGGRPNTDGDPFAAPPPARPRPADPFADTY
jgi:hypothetical protein